MASNFDFVRTAWPAIAEEAHRAEHYAFGDPRTALFYARRTLELTVQWLYRADASLVQPYRNDLSGLLYEPTFKHLVGPGILTKMDLIRRQGNAAVHRSTQTRSADSLPVVRELFHVLVWLASHYALSPTQRPPAGLPFDTTAIPKPQPGAAAKTLAQLQALASEVENKDRDLAKARDDNARLTEEISALQAQVVLAKAQNAIVPDTHDYREDETRDLFIDVLLREAGWPLDQVRDVEFLVTGMPNNSEGGQGFVDYVLWGDDGLPLGVVEAKRTRTSPRIGQQQAKLYADALERAYNQRPVIFYSNGYEHWIWDDQNYPPRQVQGFYTRDQLTLMVQRRGTRKPLGSLAISESIADRHYQQRAVRKIGEAFEKKERRALLVMATGSGKTRTAIALADVMIRANWAKRILFLADRVALVTQATNAFKALLPDAAPVNLVTDKDTEGRVYLSTYPTMMGLINDSGNGDSLRRFGPGCFDLIVVDEAHRSVYQKYGAIFDYFDGLLVGLTATPKNEIDHNTYGLFNLEDGVPTDSYDLTDAIAEHYLVPPVGRSIATQFVRDGIRYADLSAEEKEAWDLLDWADDVIPDEVDSSAMNNWLFNADTVDKVLEALMTDGRRVAGGDLLGKTIIFAKNTNHANFIAERFDKNYPEYAGNFARVITYQTTYPQSLIDDFSNPAKLPQAAITVDMLDTGIDVPDVVNLVFFKPVHSKTKYWQMVGRGTRLRPDLFGPGEDKKDFVIFDVCQNIEYFNEDYPTADVYSGRPLGYRLFQARLLLLAGIDGAGDDKSLADVRGSLVDQLFGQVSGMSVHNFLVRPHRRAVEHFSDPVRWMFPSSDEYLLAEELAGLPSAADVLDTDERAKRFDLFALRAQLGILVGDPAFDAAKARIQAIASLLAEQKSIPAVANCIELISAVATDDWWQDVTVPMIEMVRKRLRGLVNLIDSQHRSIVYTDFADTAGDPVEIELGHVVVGVDRARFREKAYGFLIAHEDDVVLFKLRHGHQLTPLDLSELERIMLESGQFKPAELSTAVAQAKGLGLFVRSLIGMDRAAASEALSTFTGGTVLTGNQLTFVNMIVDQLTSRGAMEPELLYQAPFTGVAPTGPDAIFTSAQVLALVATLRQIRATAEAV
ncbi:DEAD/DEAH box helicase family protein [Parafrigoribacterium mesophilum]|uniref:DEAD/DEAH box helicase family protein n=1 Tax=Parafrigoribacterium mesophilum TaxID=433646 RepID=UPI0031FCD896